MLLLKNADLYAPEHIGKRDILIEGEKIKKIAEKIDFESEFVEVIDLNGKKVTPGLIDQHVHITGGGGEAGPASRVPESNLTDFTTSGVTTVLGLLGTDGISRSLENLYAKAKALNEEGITCYMLTGSYTHPSPTITDTVEKDIYLLDVCIGVKIAASDHRSSNITTEELIRLATQARRGGMISGKAGVVTIHMGEGKKRLKPVMDAILESDIPIKHFIPTHINLRTKELLDDCVEFTKLGGKVDFTAMATDEANTVEAKNVFYLLEKGVDIKNITVSSDAFGSHPRFDEDGNTIGLTYFTSKILISLLKALVKEGMEFENAIKLFTENPARVLGIGNKKGKILEGMDADIVAFDENLEVKDVIAKGKVAVQDGTAILKGNFEL